MNREPLRELTTDEIAAYRRDGAVCVRAMFDRDWIRRLRAATDAHLARPGPLAQDFDDGRFFGDKYMWTTNAAFRTFVFDSPAAGIAAAVMESAKVNFFFDHLLVKEPGGARATPWHQDQPYWQVDGWQVCSLWLPLDPVTRDSGAAEYVCGSHLWGKWYEPQSFGVRRDYRAGGEAMPDIDTMRDRYEILSWDTEPGDVVIHHGRVVHGAHANVTRDRRRRALATRWTGDDARFAPRPKAPPIIRDPGIAAGAPMDCDLFPVVWPRAA